MLGVEHSYSYLRVGTAIIQIPFVFEVDHPFDEHRSVYILPALFETIHRAEERFVETGDETGRVIGVEEGLSGSVNIGGIAFVTSSRMVLAVVEKDDAFRGVDSRGTTFGKMAVEISVAWRE